MEKTAPKSSAKSGLTLTQAAHFSRLGVKYGAIGIGVLIVGRIFLTSFIAFWRAVNPPPPPPPTVGFNQLPRLEFPSLTVAIPTSYQLETASGGFPDFGDRAKVFLMRKSTPNLLADQRAREIAAIYDFVFEPEILNASTYRWQRSQPLSTQLEMDIYTQHFKINSEYLSRPDLVTQGNLPDDFAAVERVKQFLKQANLLADDVATAAGEIVYVKSLGGKLETAFSLSDAEFIQVDLNRVPIDGQYRVFTDQGYKGVIQAVISAAFNGNKSLVAIEYNYQPVDYQQAETYPIITTQDAWKILQAGEGYVADFDGEGPATIRQVQLGYYESDHEQPYLQPIYVFQGDNKFLGFVPAISSQYIQE